MTEFDSTEIALGYGERWVRAFGWDNARMLMYGAPTIPGAYAGGTPLWALEPGWVLLANQYGPVAVQGRTGPHKVIVPYNGSVIFRQSLTFEEAEQEGNWTV